MNELRVLTGLHRGASLPIDAKDMQIGASFECDLMLADPGISDLHLTLTHDAKLNICWQVNIHHKDVWLSSNKRMLKGFVIKTNTFFSVGGVWLVIMDQKKKWPTESDIVSKPKAANKQKVANLFGNKVALVGLGALIGAIALSRAANHSGDPGHDQVDPLNGYDSYSMAANQGASPNQPSSFTQNTVLTQFKKMLNDRALGDLSPSLSNTDIIINGSLSAAKIAVLERMIVRFKQVYGEKINVINNVSQELTTLPFKVVKVVTGRYAYIELDNGMRLKPGDSYKGYQLATIDKHAIKFKGDTDLLMPW